LAGTLVSGLLGVAASTVSEATGHGKYLAGSLVAGSLGLASHTVAHATGSARYPSDNSQNSHTYSAGPNRDTDTTTQAGPSGGDRRNDYLSSETPAQAGMVRRVMREHVLYLMIVNMPTEIEMSRAWDELELAGLA
jgi:hypothetical protein